MNGAPPKNYVWFRFRAFHPFYCIYHSVLCTLLRFFKARIWRSRVIYQSTQSSIARAKLDTIEMVCTQRGKRWKEPVRYYLLATCRTRFAGSYILDSCNHHGTNETLRLLYISHTTHNYSTNRLFALRICF